MATTVTIDLRHVARGLGTPLPQVQAVVELLDDGNTVPFITRYRKDQTGGLDEEQIRQIQDRLAKMRQLADRKQTILRSIESQGKLTEALSKKIFSATTTKRLEDLYLPFRPKKQTLATQARERGLEGLAREILEADPACADLDARATDFANPDRQVPSAANALLGAGHILAEQFSERADLRQKLREILQRTGKFVSTQIGGPPKPPEEKPPEEKSAEEAPADVAKPQAAEKVVEEKAAEEVVEAAPAEKVEEKPAEVVEEKPAAPQAEVVESPAEPAAETPAAETPAAETPAAETPAQKVETTEKAAVEPVEATPDSTETPAKPQAAVKQAPVKQPAAPKLSKKELKKKKADERRTKAFHDYFDYSEELKKIPPHRVLAINRGEKAKVLRVKIESDLEAMHLAIDELLVPADHAHADYLRGCARDALTRLVLPSLEREIRRELTDRAETHAVGVFAKNLRNLLLQPPVRNHRVLAVDPGFKSGCKLVALDQFGNVLEHGVIYLIGREERRKKARQKVLELIDRFQLTVAVIGNGTACRETEDFFAALITEELAEKDVAYVIVNEAGASVYSTSRLGREEFPNYDATLRGAISIGRRLQDPLSELVKIDAANIGVGLYQHDVKGKHLRTSLDEVVESCVNYVGVDVNTASSALLRYVSGMNQLTARRLCEHRKEHGPFRNREQLRDVPGLGEATFVQAAGFLKIAGGDNPLDTTWIHPESYEAAGSVLNRLNHTPADLADKDKVAALAKQVAELNLDELTKELGAGTLTLKDILAQLARPGRDPREGLPTPIFKKGVLKLEDLSQGMELTGTVLNVVDFGAFVDIGMHDSGLVHVSRLADKFVRDPHDVIAVGDIVKIWVMEVDKERRRVSLTMIKPGTERPPRPRRGEKKAGEKGDKPQTSEKPKEGVRRGGRPQRKDSRRGGDRPRGKGRGEGRYKQPEKPAYRPKPPPKPVVPISEEMKTGKEPMRTFGDLAQFFTPAEDDGKKDEGKKDSRKKGKKAKQAPKQEPAQEPAQAIETTEQPTENPVQPTENPVQPTESPVQPTESPVQPTENPVQPTESTEQPKPVDTIAQVDTVAETDSSAREVVEAPPAAESSDSTPPEKPEDDPKPEDEPKPEGESS